MKAKISILERMLILSIGFTMTLLLVRILFTRELMYGFYITEYILRNYSVTFKPTTADAKVVQI